jgi:hypothetical protein
MACPIFFIVKVCSKNFSSDRIMVISVKTLNTNQILFTNLQDELHR